VIERAIEFAIDELGPGSDRVERRREEILTEIRGLDAELGRLTAAIASGGDLPALLAALKERQAQRERYQHALTEAASARADMTSDASNTRSATACPTGARC
jgi:chromosome segregation ATPase